MNERLSYCRVQPKDRKLSTYISFLHVIGQFVQLWYDLLLENLLSYSLVEKKFTLYLISLFFLSSIGTTTPLSGFGKCIGGVTALFGVFCITLPVPIVVNSFSNFYKTRLWRSEVALKRRDRLLHAPNASKDSAHIELNGVQ